MVLCELLLLLDKTVKTVFRHGNMERANKIFADLLAQNCARYHGHQLS